MSVYEAVKDTLERLEGVPDALESQGALADAERLADEFSDVKPVPYVVPSGTFAGFPLYENK